VFPSIHYEKRDYYKTDSLRAWNRDVGPGAYQRVHAWALSRVDAGEAQEAHMSIRQKRRKKRKSIGVKRGTSTSLAAIVLAWAACLIPLVDGLSCERGMTAACFALVPASAGSIFGLHIAGASYLGVPPWYGFLLPIVYTIGALMPVGQRAPPAFGAHALEGPDLSVNGQLSRNRRAEAGHRPGIAGRPAMPVPQASQAAALNYQPRPPLRRAAPRRLRRQRMTARCRRRAR
jgi:hypothetical protein